MPNENLRLLETIKIEDSKIHNIIYHQKRCDNSRKELFNSNTPLDLVSHIKAPPKGLYRCRIIYDTCIRTVEYIPYYEKKIHSLQVVKSSIKYHLKYENREVLNRLTNIDYDDILIEKNGLVTDTSIANIAFFDGKQWLTPKTPLLEGTMRAKLLDENFLVPKDIKIEDIKGFQKVALMNAMIGFNILESLQIHDLQGNIHDY